MQNLNYRLIAEIVGGALFVILVVWFFFFRSTPGLTPAETAPQQTFGQGDTRTGANATPTDAANIGESIQSPVSTKKVFAISKGPVAGAAFMQEPRPTTTIARFVMQQSGHVLDLAIDSPGAVAHSASNTTIPSVARVAWAMQYRAGRLVASGAILQYLDNSTIKTVILTFPEPATTTQTLPSPVRIQFLPDDIRSVAASPDGTAIAYLVTTTLGSDGYIAKADGSNQKKLFSLPLSQVLLAWPAPSILLATSKAATGVAGIAFSINTTSGAAAPILYATGLSTTADPNFSYVVYQSASIADHTTYAHNVKTNLDRPLSFDPIPEKCIWSRLEASVMYCAVPLTYTAPNYLDLWHAGSASAADSIIKYNLITGATTIIATPGGADGGVPSDVMQMALSADEKELLFVKKGDRSLWGVKL